MVDFRMEHDALAPFFDKYRLYGPWSNAFHLNINHFTEADKGDEFHDHPFAFRSVILKGGYEEEILDCYDGSVWEEVRDVGYSFHVPATHKHRITKLLNGDCWTLFLPEEKTQDVHFYKLDGNCIQRRLQGTNEWHIYSTWLA